MAKGQTKSVTVIVTNKPATTATKVVELITINNTLQVDNDDINPGVNLTNNS